MVRDFVVDRRSPAESLVERRRLAVNERFLVEHRDAGMLHAAERKGGRQHVLELLERVRHAEILLERPDSRRDLGLQ